MSDVSIFSAAGIERLERELKIRLPERCREALLATTFEPEEGDIHCQDFIGGVSELIEYNNLFRSRKGKDARWPASWLIIGYCEEDLRFVDIAQRDGPVYVVDASARGALAPGEPVPSLAEWFVREKENQEEKELEYQAFEAEEQERERRRAEARKNRKWWQFWL